MSRPAFGVSAAGRRAARRRRLFCEILLACGPRWTLSTWQSGRLAPLFAPAAPPAAPAAEPLVLDDSREELQRIRRSRWWRLATRYWIARHAVRSALGLEKRR